MALLGGVGQAICWLNPGYAYIDVCQFLLIPILFCVHLYASTFNIVFCPSRICLHGHVPVSVGTMFCIQATL